MKAIAAVLMLVVVANHAPAAVVTFQFVGQSTTHLAYSGTMCMSETLSQRLSVLKTRHRMPSQPSVGGVIHSKTVLELL